MSGGKEDGREDDEDDGDDEDGEGGREDGENQDGEEVLEVEEVLEHQDGTRMAKRVSLPCLHNMTKSSTGRKTSARLDLTHSPGFEHRQTNNRISDSQ